MDKRRKKLINIFIFNGNYAHTFDWNPFINVIHSQSVSGIGWWFGFWYFVFVLILLFSINSGPAAKFYKQFNPHKEKPIHFTEWFNCWLTVSTLFTAKYFAFIPFKFFELHNVLCYCITFLPTIITCSCQYSFYL